MSVHMPAESSLSPYNFSEVLHKSSGDTVKHLDGVKKEDINQEHVVLDKAPTDAEINTMWDKIRECLHDGRKVTVPPRLFNFNPPQGNGNQALSRPVNTSTSPAIISKPLSGTKTCSSTPLSTPRKKSMDYTTQKHLVYRRQPRMRSYSDSVYSHPGHENTQYPQYTSSEPVQIKKRVQYGVQPSEETCDGEYSGLRDYLPTKLTCAGEEGGTIM